MNTPANVSNEFIASSIGASRRVCADPSSFTGNGPEVTVYVNDVHDTTWGGIVYLTPDSARTFALQLLDAATRAELHAAGFVAPPFVDTTPEPEMSRAASDYMSD